MLLYKELDADDGELTRTRKVRRGVINEKYGDIIEAIYARRAAIKVDTAIAFQDGTTPAHPHHAAGGRARHARGARPGAPEREPMNTARS